MNHCRCCSGCAHLALPPVRDYFAADSETREAMMDDVWCLHHDSEPSGLAGCDSYESVSLTKGSRDVTSA